MYFGLLACYYVLLCAMGLFWHHLLLEIFHLHLCQDLLNSAVSRTPLFSQSTLSTYLLSPYSKPNTILEGEQYGSE